GAAPLPARSGRPDAEEDVLRRVLGISAIPQHALREGDDATQVPLDEDLACGTVAGSGALHQDFVGVVHRARVPSRCRPASRRAPQPGCSCVTRLASTPGPGARHGHPREGIWSRSAAIAPPIGESGPPSLPLASAARLATRIAASPTSALAYCRACRLPLVASARSRIADVFENRRRSLRAVCFDFRSPAVAGSGRAASRSARQAVSVAQAAGATVVVVAPPRTVVVVVPLAWMPISNVVV